MSVGESESLERLSLNSVGLFYITLECVGKRKGDEALCSWIWVYYCLQRKKSYLFLIPKQRAELPLLSYQKRVNLHGTLFSLG